MDSAQEDQYYLQVLPEGEAVAWPVPDEELVVGSQKIPGGLVQYWAYPKSAAKDPEKLPHAQVLAAQAGAYRPVVLIDQIGRNLELILVKNGIAYSRADSSVANLEENLTAILEFAKIRFNIRVEDFMTTSRVEPETESKLDEISSNDEETSQRIDNSEVEDGDLKMEGSEMEESDQSSTPDPQDTTINSPSSTIQDEPRTSFQNLATPRQSAENVFRRESTFDLERGRRGSNLSKLILFIVLVIVLGAVGYFFKDTFLSKFKPQPSPEPEVEETPTPTPSPSLAPTVERSQYQIRVLNGTTKTGAASSLADKLKALGWKTLSVGNATDSATAQTLVRVKAGSDDLAATLIKDLSPDMEATRSTDLKTSDSADAEVVIGKK